MQTMISQCQNTQINIQRLAAQRRLYSTAKVIHLIRFTLTFPFLLSLSIVVAFLRSKEFTASVGIYGHDLSWLLALSSVLVFIVDYFILDPIEQKKKGIAAGVQEEFDCDVLQIPWNPIEVRNRPVRETTISNAKRYLDKHGSEELYNWYTCPDEIPLPAARLICQRENVSWDAGLRRKYLVLLLILIAIVTVGIVAFALRYGVSCEVILFAVVAPIIPGARFVFGEIKQNRTAVRCLEEIRDIIEEQWRGILTSTITETQSVQRSRDLQNRIYTSRKANTLIPDWLYDKLKPSQETFMFMTAEHMKEEYFSAQRTLPSPP